MWRYLWNVFRQDTLLSQAMQESYEMLEIDLSMFDASVRSLRESDDGTIDVDILKLDKRINRFERDVRRKVLSHLAVGGPTELSSSLILVSIISDIERIGDYAKNIYDLARYHPKRLVGGRLEDEVKMVETNTTQLFRDMVAAFRESDEEKARIIMTGYKGGLSADCERIVEKIVSGQATDLGTETGSAICLYVRYLKRIGAHSRNIVTSVVNPFPRLKYREKKTK